MKDDRQEIAVTGIGVFTSIGCKKEEFWNSLVSGKSGVKKLRAFDPEGHKCQVASEVFPFSNKDYLTGKQIRKMARFSQLATCASIEAVRDSGLELEKEDTTRIGCIIGSAAGDYENILAQHNRFQKKGPGSVNPFSVPKIIPNMPPCNVAIELGLHGPNFGVATACATGSYAIGMGLGILRQGLADVVLAGGTESTIVPMVVDGYATMGTLTRRNGEPEKASRPFDADRDGFVIGEGAGVLVLETMEHAEQRGAEPLALLTGFGMSCDAHNIALPEPNGKWAAASIANALNDARLNPEDIGYINAHGTSTKSNDKTETLAIKQAFGDYSKDIPVSSTKSMIGHTLGAAGAIEAAAVVLTVHNDIIPPTINLQTRDPECDLDYVPNEARKSKVNAAISNSFGFGGQNGVLVFSKV